VGVGGVEASRGWKIEFLPAFPPMHISQEVLFGKWTVAVSELSSGQSIPLLCKAGLALLQVWTWPENIKGFCPPGTISSVSICEIRIFCLFFFLHFLNYKNITLWWGEIQTCQKHKRKEERKSLPHKAYSTPHLTPLHTSGPGGVLVYS
jgi:hypothetical protein